MRSLPISMASLVALVFFFTIAGVEVRAVESESSGQQPVDQQTVRDGEAGILVLQDGGVLTGEITRAAGWYLLSRAGGQMQIAEPRVMLVCHTMAEAYEFKRRQIPGGTAADHLRLAEWCIRYELPAEAGRELAEVRRLDPDLPRLALLERRLEKGNGVPKAKESVYLANANLKAKPPLRQAQDHSALDKLGTEGQAVVAPKAAVPLADLPGGVVEVFTRKIQPVLVNNCTTTGCHETGGKQSFQLDRSILRGESNRRTTMHNLEATLALVDRDHPDLSPLLTVPRRTHGGTAGPVFGPRKDQVYKRMVDWVAIVVPAAPAPVAEETTAPVDANAIVESKPVPVVQPVGAEVEKSGEDAKPSTRRQAVERAIAASDEAGNKSLRAPHRLQVGLQAKSWHPRDAFDPEIFNRQQRARSQGMPVATESSDATAVGTAAVVPR